MADNTGSPPVPDPTALTTDQLLREISNVRAWAKAEMDGHAALQAEKIKSLEKRLDMTEEYRREQKEDTSKAIDTALTGTNAQITAQATAFGDLKDRVGRIESIKQGAGENRAGIYAAIGAVGIGLAALVVLMSMLSGTGS